MSYDSPTLRRITAMRMACPEWPDCADDEGPCQACSDANQVIAALERAERVEAAARELLADLKAEYGWDDGTPLEVALAPAPGEEGK